MWVRVFFSVCVKEGVGWTMLYWYKYVTRVLVCEGADSMWLGVSMLLVANAAVNMC